MIDNDDDRKSGDTLALPEPGSAQRLIELTDAEAALVSGGTLDGSSKGAAY